MDVRARARRIKQQNGDLGIVIIDYLQLMSSRGRAENRQVEVSEMSRSLKILARELECPVLALSQLSRKLEERADKRPMMSDLRESGSLEQDADVVLFLYRPEIYGEVPNDMKADAEIIVGNVTVAYPPPLAADARVSTAFGFQDPVNGQIRRRPSVRCCGIRPPAPRRSKVSPENSDAADASSRTVAVAIYFADGRREVLAYPA